MKHRQNGDVMRDTRITVAAVVAGLLLPLAIPTCVQASDASPFANAPITDSELGAVAGKEQISQLGTIDQDSVVSHNAITGDSVTGKIVFDGQAFQNMNGLAVINANTGNNVSFNSSMLVNIVIGPRP
jgi:hypothetical protein